jgi:RNA polymerase sigma-70 factor (family 1)
MELSPNPEAAFQRLFTLEYEKLCKYAYSYMQDTHLSEDVVQETFIKIWEQKKELISSPDIKFYLITAVRNNCITAIRKQKSQRTNFTDTTPEPDPEPFFTEMQHREMDKEEAKAIAEALNLLPPKCKEIFLLIKMHGMSYKQAAQTLELSVKTIENQMGKAIKLFRDFAVSRPVILWLFFIMKKLVLLMGVNAVLNVL